MDLLIVGASGQCGQWVVRLARERGHIVTALVRAGADFKAPEGVRTLRGDILEPSTVESAMIGVEAVISCVGLRRRSSWFPWSRLSSPTDLTTRVVRIMIDGMRSTGVRRIIVISAAGVGESSASLSPAVRVLLRQGSIGTAYRDLEGMEALLAQSGLDWLAVRPVTLTQGALSGRAGEIDRFRLASRVRRADVAAWMLDAVVKAGPFTRHAVMLGQTDRRRAARHRRYRAGTPSVTRLQKGENRD